MLLLVDIFYFKNLQLKEKDYSRKVNRSLKRKYKNFLSEQNMKFEDFEMQK